MYDGVCPQTKPSKTVHSFVHDKHMNAYGVELKSQLHSMTPKKFFRTQISVRTSPHSFENYLRKCL